MVGKCLHREIRNPWGTSMRSKQFNPFWSGQFTALLLHSSGSNWFSMDRVKRTHVAQTHRLRRGSVFNPRHHALLLLESFAARQVGHFGMTCGPDEHSK